MELQQKKVKAYKDENIPVHIVTKDNKWINGYIQDAGNSDYFIVNDFHKGEVIVFHIEISLLEKYKQKEKSDGN